MINNNFEKSLLDSTNSESYYIIEEVQELWDGYGKILRLGLCNSDIDRVVVKVVQPPGKKDNLNIKNSLSYKRKLKSYKIESEWYKNWSYKCNERCYIPKCYTVENFGNEFFMVLEDLDLTGFPLRKQTLHWNEVMTCISWLANFHAVFMNEKPVNLWKNGTYWHLDTRPDELKTLTDIKLKKAAYKIDGKLKNCKFKTILHGDAKLCNFCFSDTGKKVAAVDFQYVGGGCGMKDVAYFMGSCFYENECETYEKDVLNYYFLELKEALKFNNKKIDFNSIEKEWRYMFKFAWADFHRFIKGWASGKWKNDSYSEKTTRQVLKLI